MRLICETSDQNFALAFWQDDDRAYMLYRRANDPHIQVGIGQKITRDYLGCHLKNHRAVEWFDVDPTLTWDRLKARVLNYVIRMAL